MTDEESGAADIEVLLDDPTERIRDLWESRKRFVRTWVCLESGILLGLILIYGLTFGLHLDTWQWLVTVAFALLLLAQSAVVMTVYRAGRATRVAGPAMVVACLLSPMTVLLVFSIPSRSWHSALGLTGFIPLVLVLREFRRRIREERQAIELVETGIREPPKKPSVITIFEVLGAFVGVCIAVAIALAGTLLYSPYLMFNWLSQASYSSDGRQIAYQSLFQDDRCHASDNRLVVYVATSEGEKPRPLSQGQESFAPRWSPTDPKLGAFVETSPTSTTWSVYDVNGDGEATAVNGNVAAWNRVIGPPISSPNGLKYAWIGTDKDRRRHVVVTDPNGRNATWFPNSPDSTAFTTRPSWSPDSNSLAYVVISTDTAAAGVWIANAQGGNARRISTRVSGVARWSPEGSAIALNPWSDAKARAVVTVSPDGGSEQVITNSANVVDAVWSPDGVSLAIDSGDDSGYQLNIWNSREGSMREVFRFDDPSSNSPTFCDARAFALDIGGWSPDGKTVLVNSDHGGRSTILAVDVASGTSKQIVSEPRWLPMGRRFKDVPGWVISPGNCRC